MVLQQADTVRGEKGGQITVENSIEDQGEDEAEEAFSGLGVVVERGLEFDQGLGLRSNAGREEGKGLVWRGGEEGRARGSVRQKSNKPCNAYLLRRKSVPPFSIINPRHLQR